MVEYTKKKITLDKDPNKNTYSLSCNSHVQKDNKTQIESEDLINLTLEDAIKQINEFMGNG